MKTRLVALVVVGVLLLSAGMAWAENGGLYFTGRAGLGFMGGDVSFAHNQTATPTDEKDTWTSDVFSYGAAVGWNWVDAGLPLRTEVEYYDHGSVKMKYEDSNSTFSAKADIQTMQMNLFWDFYTDTRLIPYLGAGFGVANLKNSLGKSSSNFSYSLFAGAGYELTDHLLLDFMYRINQFGESKVSWKDEDNSYNGKMKDMYGVEAVFGLRWQF